MKKLRTIDPGFYVRELQLLTDRGVASGEMVGEIKTKEARP